MPLADITKLAVLAAVREFDELGRDEFLRHYGFRPAREYYLFLNDRRYDSKAIVGAAHKFAVPTAGPLRPSDFSGGEATVARALGALGFWVQRLAKEERSFPSLNSGQIYAWEELGVAFGFRAPLFQVGGGMLSRPEFNAVLLVTHPGGAHSIDYEDRWDGATLIYTGRGKVGDQRLEGPNRDVAENRKRLIVFEAAEARRLRYLGEAKCIGSWIARADDSQRNPRDVLKFRLAFDHAVEPLAPLSPSIRNAISARRSNVLMQPRPFVAGLLPTRRVLVATTRASPEQILAQQEKAILGHYKVLASLAEFLRKSGWTAIEEIPAAVDLWGTAPDGGTRVIFEVKTLSASNEGDQCRAALSQLLEYRFFFGAEVDRLCVVLDRPIADRRRALLEALGVAVLVISTDGSVRFVGGLAHMLFRSLSVPVQAERAGNMPRRLEHDGVTWEVELAGAGTMGCSVRKVEVIFRSSSGSVAIPGRVTMAGDGRLSDEQLVAALVEALEDR